MTMRWKPWLPFYPGSVHTLDQTRLIFHEYLQQRWCFQEELNLVWKITLKTLSFQKQALQQKQNSLLQWGLIVQTQSFQPFSVLPSSPLTGTNNALPMTALLRIPVTVFPAQKQHQHQARHWYLFSKQFNIHFPWTPWVRMVFQEHSWRLTW